VSAVVLAKVSGVVFDLDGTLVDSRRDIAEAANYALARNGYAELPHEELESFVGDGAPLLMSRAARLDVAHHGGVFGDDRG
jgi:phosphoglycolate phosphatase